MAGDSGGDRCDPRTTVSTWTPSLVVVLLLLGVIPTLIAVWACELTPDGLRPDAQVAASTGLQTTAARARLIA